MCIKKAVLKGVGVKSKNIILLNLFLLFFISVFLFYNSKNVKTNVDYSRIFYGNDKEQFIDYYNVSHPKGLVVYVHGGGYITGSSDSENADKVVSFFTSRGFSVSSIEYRKCNEVGLNMTLEDIFRGIKKSVDVYSLKNKKVLVGFSSGSMALYIGLFKLNYSEYLMNNFDNFILMSGIYKTSNVPDEYFKRHPCSKEIVYYLGLPERDIEMDDTFMVLEGNKDYFDVNAGTEKSHLNYIVDKLRKRRAEVVYKWFDGGHESTFNVFNNPDFIERFIGD